MSSPHPKSPNESKRPRGSIYVITDKQIRQMGARYLSDVIDTVPGWYLFEDDSGVALIFANGKTGENSYILFMVNSLVVNNPNDGGEWIYQSLDLDNVKQIEFVTGPGSSLYGSNAVAGIINIITKEGEDVDGLQLTGRGGSYDTYETNALFGKTIEGLEVAAYVDYLNTGGFRGHVDRDQQSVYDELYNTHSSLAPGNMKGDAHQWDGQLTMKYKGFKFDGKYLGRKRDLPFGHFPKLDNRSWVDNRQYYLNLSYDNRIMEGLDFTAKMYRNQYLYSGTSQITSKGGPILTPTGPAIAPHDLFF